MNYHISTLLYCFDEEDRTLLLHRTHEPNQGLWSPCGGKLKTDLGESPYACAVRELEEETGMVASIEDLHLSGIISECGYEGKAHWLMFLFEIKKRFRSLPPQHPEGTFRFFKRSELDTLPLPQTDREYIWPLFWKYRHGFFSAHCHVTHATHFTWQIEEAFGKNK